MNVIAVELLDQRDRSVAKRIHAIQMAAYEQEALLIGAIGFPPLRRTVANVRQSTDRFFGAYFGLVLAGVVSVCIQEEEDETNISSLVVSPEFQRRGIGRALVTEVISQFKDQTVTVSSGALNRPALELYEKLGFTEVRRRLLGKTELPVIDLRRERGIGE